MHMKVTRIDRRSHLRQTSAIAEPRNTPNGNAGGDGKAKAKATLNKNIFVPQKNKIATVLFNYT